ncbi:bifunctional folylpolyglutamate synthase/dihydrofolate synthase [Metabacillus arenae]|uniref:Dihydrofolate synthase/folylpolyglutamate synthase n=1 Tax=Metabacillus arenae TaxID=2771434 RepID=A0A926NNG4_9BACI|nr:folylpolyglutamate synthase/dihydrofolate synthase family protein [Metabacillus arenae]MBD1381192.1 bifunctional folylpolyglutamate synthase/dihydrofolate synthase [Metabacillus arenae]
MAFTYEEAVDWIHSRLKFGIKPGLERMKWMMKELGNPEKKIQAIHVGGTNGKGSTVAYLRNILNESGYSVGTFTSPYIETFNERISINGLPIEDQNLTNLVEEIKPLVEKLEKTHLGSPTEFEVITAMAFHYFGNRIEVDAVLFEVGLGGLYDSTNIVEPIMSIITSIGHDHMNILGKSLKEIAGQKAGIIKPNIPVITGVQDDDALKVILEKANQKDSQPFVIDKDFYVHDMEVLNSGELFSVKTPNHSYKSVKINMRGLHQIHNASLAVMAADLLNANNLFTMNDESIRRGLMKTSWIGRFERIHQNPEVIIDGAHNQEGIDSLVSVLNRHYKDRSIHILFSALEDKDFKEMVSKLDSIAKTISFTSFPFPRAASAHQLYDASKSMKKFLFENWKEAIDSVVRQKSQEDVIIITGSLYFISLVRRYCRKKL